MEAIKKKGYVYEFLDEKENIVYIGSTGNIVNRMKQHFTIKRNGKMGAKEYDSVKMVQYAECDSRNGASIAEIYLIQKYHPSLNSEYSEWGETNIVRLDERKLKWERKTPAEFFKEKPRKVKKANVKKTTPTTQKPIRAVTYFFPQYHIRHGKESQIVKEKVGMLLFTYAEEMMRKNIGTDEEWEWSRDWFMERLQRELRMNGCRIELDDEIKEDE